MISHGDFAPWNMVTRAGNPIALIDWECAGPVDPVIELSRACWLFAQLHDDDVADLNGLPPTPVRAQHVRLLADAYGASAADRALMVSRMVEIAIHETADEAMERKIAPGSEGPQWALAWKAARQRGCCETARSLKKLLPDSLARPSANREEIGSLGVTGSG
ncbi:MAG TPA: phosphotransferase [Bryobacteraceae bacterium]|nr:phosphotransferase [Bryobacteraceae bacterium]